MPRVPTSPVCFLPATPAGVPNRSRFLPERRAFLGSLVRPEEASPEVAAWLGADDPRPLVAEGSWRGEIVATPRGTNGFGYDPLFLLREHGKTAAELDPAEKNRVSHRGRALQRLISRLQEEG